MIDDEEDERAHQLLTDHLTRLRAARRLTQEQLAELSDLSTDTVRRLEARGQSPTFRTLRKLAVGLDLPLQTVFAALEPHQADPMIEELVMLLRSAPPDFPLRQLIDLIRQLLR